MGAYICCESAQPEIDTYVATKNTGARHSLSSQCEEDAIDTAITEDENNRRLAEQQGGRRRQAVAGEGVSSTALAAYVKPVYPKDDATAARIRGIIRSDDKMQVLFGHLDSASLDDIVMAFKDVTGERGETFIRQGEAGECLYIINEGEVDVFVARPGLDGKVSSGERGPRVVTLGPGALFGELALMYSAPRAATVCIASPVCKLWQLDREPFKMVLAKQSQSTYAMYQGWLAEVDLFKTLNRYELSRLSDLLESTLYDDDEEIIKQGELGDKFYILEDGTCAAYITGPSGERRVKEYTQQGDYFGEIALLTAEPRKASVRATGEGCSVLSLSQADFTLILGPIKDILQKDIDKYPQYAQFLK